MSVSNAGTCDRKRSDGNGCKFPPLGKVPRFFNLFCARERQSPAKNSDGLSDSGGGCVARINSRFSGKKGIGHGGSLGDKGRAFCFGRPRALESTVASRSSDANDPTFTHEIMRNSLERNDFYSKECNPHLRR